MFKILVPVDFFKTSFAAFNYAANFSQLFSNVEITLLHVSNGSYLNNESSFYDPLNAIEVAAYKRLTYFHEDYYKELGIELPKVNVKKEVLVGLPGYAIAEYANSHDIDIVIMGTRDKHNLFDRLLGSVSALTLRNSNCPVLLIHENVRFNKPSKIVFAFDAISDIEDAVEDFQELNAVIKAKTDFIHVRTHKNDNVEHQKAEIVEELIEDEEPSFSFEIKTIEGNDIQTALRDYCLFNKSDMLVMMHREEGIFRFMFGTSESVKMAQEFHLPVLVLHEDD